MQPRIGSLLYQSTDKPASGTDLGRSITCWPWTGTSKLPSKPRGFSCRELAALVGATLPQGRFPCHLFCSSLPQSGLRNVSSSFSSIHSVASFFFSAFLTLPCQSRRRSLPLLAIVLFSAPRYHQLHLFRPPSSKARNDVASTTDDGSSADLSRPSPQRHMRSAVLSS